MESGYKIYWTEHALAELDSAFEYLEANFSTKEVKRLAQKTEDTIELVSRNPNIFPYSEKSGIFKVTILRYNSIYYRVAGNRVEILSFFSNRQNPKKKKL